jgi:hypothetical protein
MNDGKFLRSLSQLGLSMFEPNEALNVSDTLARVVKSHDTRLWEGFPVLVANVTDQYQFEPEKVEAILMNREEKGLFRELMLMSGALFSHYHISFSWWNKLQKKLSEKERKLVNKWKNDLADNNTLNFNDVELDPERLKGVFELYFEDKAEKGKRQKEKYKELSLEYSLSQVFSPKQKELFKKKLEGLPLTKTEQEYFSRTVKKKVLALANSELHGLSKKILGL